MMGDFCLERKKIQAKDATCKARVYMFVRKPVVIITTEAALAVAILFSNHLNLTFIQIGVLLLQKRSNQLLPYHFI